MIFYYYECNHINIYIYKKKRVFIFLWWNVHYFSWVTRKVDSFQNKYLILSDTGYKYPQLFTIMVLKNQELFVWFQIIFITIKSKNSNLTYQVIPFLWWNVHYLSWVTRKVDSFQNKYLIPSDTGYKYPQLFTIMVLKNQELFVWFQFIFITIKSKNSNLTYQVTPFLLLFLI